MILLDETEEWFRLLKRIGEQCSVLSLSYMSSGNFRNFAAGWRTSGQKAQPRSLPRISFRGIKVKERGGGKGGSSPTPRSPTASSEFSLVVNFHHGARAPHPLLGYSLPNAQWGNLVCNDLSAPRVNPFFPESSDPFQSAALQKRRIL